MRTPSIVVAVALLALGAAAAGWFAGRAGDEPEAVTATITETTTEPARETGLPAAVEATRTALLAAAAGGDYEALRPLVSTDLSYSFGGPVEGGPIAHWRQLEENTAQRPLETLAAVLRMPYTLSRGYYVWPFAYDVADVEDLSPHERSLLKPLGAMSALFVDGTGYLGWRAGIRPDGTWSFFVAGD